MWNGVDPLAEKYPGMTPYNYVGNNPINNIDIRGDSITPILTKGGGKDGRDLLTINFTGKFINLSGKDVDMNKALSRIKNRMESVFDGENINGVDMNLNFNFSVVESMKDVGEGDHLLILANGKKWNIPGIASDIGGTVATVEAGYFRGWYDSTIGGEGVRTATHELGHLLGLEHVKSVFNLMIQGPSLLRGNNISNDQMSTIQKLMMNPLTSNIGTRINNHPSKVGQLPAIGRYANSLFRYKIQ